MFGTTEMLLIIGATLLLFGPDKLPEIARSLGKTIGDFKKAMRKTQKKSFPLFKYISDQDDYRYHIYLPGLCSLLYCKDNTNNSRRYLCNKFCSKYRIDEKIRLAHLSNIK